MRHQPSAWEVVGRCRTGPQGPRVLEVNARLASGLIGYLVHLATGINLGTVAADIACGRVPLLESSNRGTAASRMFRPATSGILAERRLLPDSPRPWLRRLLWLRDAGDPVAANRLLTTQRSGAVGFAVVTAPTSAEARGHLDGLERNVIIAARSARSRT
ncbi:hypothetical protein [Kitasatospora sp. NPDC098663]|uniref:hypothetical protein n=1 Tax=Kitasatospora sp. NPDC098663 TaxID=3364096 RepID=UPI0037F67CF7